MAVFASGVHCAARASNSPPTFTADLAFDQIGRVLTDTPPPPPGPSPDGFASDARRIADLPAIPKADGIMAAAEATRALGMTPLTAPAAQLGAIALGAATNAYTARATAVGKAYMQAGSMTHAWFYRGWTRLETPALHSVAITKPDQGLEIWLDPAARTYREKRKTVPGQDAEVYSVSAADDVRISFDGGNAPMFKTMNEAVLEGLAVRGYRTDATFSVSGTLGFCSKGSHVLSEVEYVADVPDPQVATGPALGGSALAREVCLPTNSGSHREPGRLVLYRAISLTGGPPYGDLVSVLERANLRSVGAAESSLFSVPSEYKEVP
ncbi:MAG TPA: hypothetical protein VGI65_19385 [Steroidobacteraceae bacterium]|jgi:hypothetical protein